VVAFDKHLLSVKDNNQSANLAALIDAGVGSFKIEGRYKDAGYVKNITGHYRLLLDRNSGGTRGGTTSAGDSLPTLTLPARGEGVCTSPTSGGGREGESARPILARASSGHTRLLFEPDPDKTFHRGSTDYFAQGRKADIGAFDTPAFVGLPLGTVSKVGPDWFELETEQAMANGDGLTYLNKREIVGLQANTVENRGRQTLAGLPQRIHRHPPRPEDPAPPSAATGTTSGNRPWARSPPSGASPWAPNSGKRLPATPWT
jgi:hypothetical protein